MTISRRTWIVIGALVALLGGAAAGAYYLFGQPRQGRATLAELRADIVRLERERADLVVRRDALLTRDQRMKNVPDTPIKVGVPTTLARSLIEKVVSGFTDQVTIELQNLKVARSGTIKKVVTLGQYDLHINVDRVRGRLKPGTPTVTFEPTAVALRLPVSVVSGSGRATVNFTWDSTRASSMVCGDMAVTREITGTVVPASYPFGGRLEFETTDTHLVLRPRLPATKIHVTITPSAESWAAAQKVLDDKTGVCGFVLDRVDIMKTVRAIVDKGFTVPIPLNRLKPMVFPIGVEPELDVGGRKVALKAAVGTFTMNEHALWLGIDLAFRVSPRMSRPRR